MNRRGDILKSGTLWQRNCAEAISLAGDEMPTISKGVLAPATTPAKVGDVYIDTSAKKVYFATGNSSSSDWTAVN